MLKQGFLPLLDEVSLIVSAGFHQPKGSASDKNAYSLRHPVV